MNLKAYELVFVTREGKILPGARYRAYNFSQELQNLGFNAQVFSYHECLGALNGALERYLNFKDKIFYNIKAYIHFKKYQNPLFIIQRFNYHSFGPFLYALVKKKKFILDLDDWEFREDIKYYLRNIYSNSKAENITRLIAKKAILCLSGSKYLYHYLKNINSHTFYLPPAVDLDNFIYREKFTPGDKITLGWIGTMFREEDFLNLRFIFKIIQTLNHPQIFLEIIGDGIWKNNLEKEVRKLRVKNVEFKGWVAPSKIPEYLDNIDIGICPLVVKNKFTRAKFPVKVIEFMAKGIPVIGSKFGELLNIITDGKDGFLVENEKDFITRILLLLDKPSLRKEIGFNARKKIENLFSLKTRVQELISIIENVS